MIYINFTIYNNGSENSSKAIVHKTNEKKNGNYVKRPKLTWKPCLFNEAFSMLIWVFLRRFHNAVSLVDLATLGGHAFRVNVNLLVL